jgi:hypothetical protein
MKIPFLTLTLVALLAACQSKITSSEKSTNDHQIIIKEVVQTTNYSYLKVTENDKEEWLAVPLSDAKIGETYYYAGGMEMSNFESKELKRTFDKVLFLDGISKAPITAQNANSMQQTAVQGSPKSEKQQVRKMDPVQGGISIAELYAKKDSYTGKTVKIKGQVTKITEAVMNKNWIHIQDGTQNGEDYDLTVTSLITPKIGDIITVEGKITLDKDLGHGYKYKILMEDAVSK